MGEKAGGEISEGESRIISSRGTQEQILTAWEKFLETGELEIGVVSEAVASSWKRSKLLNVDPYMKKIKHKVSSEERDERFKKSRILLEVAQPFLADLYKSIREMEVALILADKKGFVLDTLAEGIIKEEMEVFGLVPGQYINEETMGTAAPSLALQGRKPVRVVANEHWCKSAKICTCAAAPIFKQEGNMVGVLDITSRYDIAEEHPHTYGLVLAAAKAVETQLRLRLALDELYVSHEYLNAAVQSMSDGLIILDGGLNIVQINNLACRLTGLDTGKRLDKSITDAGVLEKIRALTSSRSGFCGLETVCSNPKSTDQRILLDAEPILDVEGHWRGVVLILRELKRVRKLAQRIYGDHAVYIFEDLIGEDPEFRMCVETLKLASQSESPIVITGESGTGKEMFAQAVHNHSHRRDGPFIPLNCAAIPRDLLESELFGYDEGAFTGAKRGGNPGKFELADGGTIFLDEIDSMPLYMQAKLLRVIEEKRVLRLGGKAFIPVDVRIIAASCRDLEKRIHQGGFRDDLYYRINVVGVNIPPLRERCGDIPVLAEHFMKKSAKSPSEMGRFLKPDILDTLRAYEWPGNVRELSNWVERLLTIGDRGEPSHEIKASKRPKQDMSTQALGSENMNSIRIDEVEALLIKEAIVRNKGMISRAACDLGISSATVYRRIAKYGIDLKRIKNKSI
ncbi:MAG: sigma 54-interacting transcriptional regulator [Actinomycetota bacterium]|nr:sigma 54-interacting transcriptional regulator [Actinomycetota bacterium]